MIFSATFLLTVLIVTYALYRSGSEQRRLEEKKMDHQYRMELLERAELTGGSEW